MTFHQVILIFPFESRPSPFELRVRFQPVIVRKISSASSRPAPVSTDETTLTPSSLEVRNVSHPLIVILPDSIPSYDFVTLIFPAFIMTTIVAVIASSHTEISISPPFISIVPSSSLLDFRPSPPAPILIFPQYILSLFFHLIPSSLATILIFPPNM
jgi:hypothetical protein